jgi:hypothetical protein
MTFRITRHSGARPPEDAIDQLWERLGLRHEETTFLRVGSEIRARWGEHEAASARDERVEVGRREVLEIVREVCERAPAIKSDWYAVAFMP